MKKLIPVIIAIVIAYTVSQENDLFESTQLHETEHSSSSVQTAYANRQSNIQVQGKGVVSRLLADDNEGSRHQKFILKLANSKTVLVAHNIDLAPRIKNLGKGDTVEFYGEYEWNAKGGVIHWTHHDPNNLHTGGWLKHRGQIYQ